MHIWRIEQLKDEIRERGMADDDVISYFVASMGLLGAAGALPLVLPGPWNWVQVGWNVLLGFAGTFYLYQANRGRMGQLFLQRFFALGWVIGIRWLLACGLIFGPLVAGFLLVQGAPVLPPWVYGLSWAGATVVFYWRIAVHLRDLSHSD